MTDDFNPTEWITTKEAAEGADYATDHVRRLCNAGKVKARRIGGGGPREHGGAWLIRRGSLLKCKRNVEPRRPRERRGDNV